MENENVNVGNQQNEMSLFEQKMNKMKSEGITPKRKTKEEIFAKHFTPTNDTEVVRIVPPKNQNVDFFDVLYFHVLNVNSAGGQITKNKKILCLNQVKRDQHGNPVIDNNGKYLREDKPCPACIKAKEFELKKDTSIQYIKKINMDQNQLAILAKNTELFKRQIYWESKVFYIAKLIDRKVESDGIKFYRFKENRLNEGVFDLFKVAIDNYYKAENKNFRCVTDGCDFNIVTRKKTNPGTKRQYTEVLQIIPQKPSPLHNDNSVAVQWTTDTITTDEVYKAAAAPHINEYQFMEMLVNGGNPYWDDSNSQNKHWVYPNRPDLEEKANTRNQNLDANSQNQNTINHTAADSNVNITNITESQTGTNVENAVDLGKAVVDENVKINSDYDYSSSSEDYDDLPF